jgi:hypothetical protein
MESSFQEIIVNYINEIQEQDGIFFIQNLENLESETNEKESKFQQKVPANSCSQWKAINQTRLKESRYCFKVLNFHSPFFQRL